MKTLETAKITDLVRMISLVIMLANMLIYFIRFIRDYLLLPLWYCVLNLSSIFMGLKPRKKVTNKTIHHHKYAPFIGNPNGFKWLFGT